MVGLLQCCADRCTNPNTCTYACPGSYRSSHADPCTIASANSIAHTGADTRADARADAHANRTYRSSRADPCTDASANSVAHTRADARADTSGTAPAGCGHEDEGLRL